MFKLKSINLLVLEALVLPILIAMIFAHQITLSA